MLFVRRNMGRKFNICNTRSIANRKASCLLVFSYTELAQSFCAEIC